ncbi:MAG: VWA domain-containing protein [Gemmataceae bacterium]
MPCSRVRRVVQHGGTRRGKTRLERAKDAANSVIDNLPPNSTIQILACSDRCQSLGPVSPRNLDQARQIIVGLEVTSLSTDFLPAITEAMTALITVPARKRKCTCSTCRSPGFGPADRSGAGQGRGVENRDGPVRPLRRSGPRSLTNAILSDLTSSPAASPHQGDFFTAIIQNHGRDPIRNLTMTLEVDGKTGEKETEAAFLKSARRSDPRHADSQAR